MPTCEFNPYGAQPSVISAPRSTLHLLGATLGSSFVFTFSFLSLGSLARTFSFSFAYTYTCEMLIDQLLWILPMFVGYASLDALFRFVRKSPKPVFWPMVSGASSFVLFDRVWDSTQGVADFLREPLSRFVDVDFIRMVVFPPWNAFVIEVWVILLFTQLRKHVPAKLGNAA